ncbi:MAG: sporulation protein [Geobacteraceae bacterium GWC2_48_7]|nr:MAG: sporulation protein [Geobacteraceae bacterium GWC2_48_7]
MKKIISITVAIVLVGFLIYAITFQKKVIPVEKPGKVISTAAYEKYFGAAPSVDKGMAYAFVIYFPSSKSPGKVVPFPFFTFEEESLKKVAIQRLLGGMDTGSYQGEFTPFPSGTRLISINDDKGMVTINFSKELDKSPEAGMSHALALTLHQFKEVNEIRILVEGKETTLNALAKNVDHGAVQQLSPPRLLSVTAMRDKGAKDIEEMNVFFDRPVDVKELKLLSKDGQQFAGDLYHSVFDMAAVLKPKDPSQFRERMPITVRWKIIDKLGRQAEGENVWLLEIKEH